MGLEQDWESATPVAPATSVAPAQPSLQQQFEQSGPPPSMGQVALNAIPKGMANLLNTPMTLASLIMHGISNLPGLSDVQGIQQAAQNPTLNRNIPMELATQIGAVNPAMNPQTGPQRIVDMAIQGAIGGAAVPAGGAKGVAMGAGVGAASGAVAQTTKEVTGSDLLAIAAGLLTPFAISGLGKTAAATIGPASRKETLKAGREVGYVVEPSSVKASALGSKIESIGGKAAIAQNAAERNQGVTNALAAKAIGLPEDTPLSMSVIEEVRKRAKVPYEEVEALSNTPLHGSNLPGFPQTYGRNLLDQLKQARADASAYYRHYDRSADPASLKLAKENHAVAEQLESNMEALANAAGKPELVEKLQAARQLYARTYDVERALNLGDGNVSAPIIGRMYDQGRPLSGELQVIGRFAQAFPRVMREAAGLPPSGVSGVDAASAALLATAGAGAAGPAGLMAGAAPLARGTARNIVLSERYQSGLLKEPAPPTPLSTTALRAGMVGKGQAQEGMEETPAP